MIEALAGILSGCEITMPMMADKVAMMTPKRSVYLKVLDILEAIAAGKIMRDVISKTPMDRTPMTINNDVKTARKYLINGTFTFKNNA